MASEWATVVGIITVLGFLLSLIIFLVTRWEKRPKLDMQLFVSDLGRLDPKLDDDSFESKSMVCVRVINSGVKAIVIDNNSFKVSAGNKTITIFAAEWIGLDRIPYPVTPGSSFEVGIFQDDFERLMGVAEFKRYMNSIDYEKCTVVVTAGVRSISGKDFTSGNRYQYSFYVSEFWPAQHLGS